MNNVLIFVYNLLSVFDLNVMMEVKIQKHQSYITDEDFFSIIFVRILNNLLKTVQIDS